MLTLRQPRAMIAGSLRHADERSQYYTCPTGHAKGKKDLTYLRNIESYDQLQAQLRYVAMTCKVENAD